MLLRRATFAFCVLTLGAVFSVQNISASDLENHERHEWQPDREFFSRYQEMDLISDVPGLAVHLDENLVNPWGIVHGPTSPCWTNALLKATTPNASYKGLAAASVGGTTTCMRQICWAALMSSARTLPRLV